MIYIRSKNNKSKHCFSENIKSGNNVGAQNFGIMDSIDQNLGVEGLTKNVAIGSVAGAGIGGLGNLLVGDEKKSKMRRLLEGAGLGALAGGVAGGGYSLYENLKDRDSKLSEAKTHVDFLEEELATESNERTRAENHLKEEMAYSKDLEGKLKSKGSKIKRIERELEGSRNRIKNLERLLDEYTKE